MSAGRTRYTIDERKVSRFNEINGLYSFLPPCIIIIYILYYSMFKKEKSKLLSLSLNNKKKLLSLSFSSLSINVKAD